MVWMGVLGGWVGPVYFSFLGLCSIYDGLGLVGFDEVYDFVVDGLEALCEVVVGGGGDSAVGDVGEFVAFGVDDAVAGGGGAWVEAEYAHYRVSN